MSVQLESIQFNHDSNSASHDGLNLRRNATQTITLPEWRRGASINPEDAPVAYSIADTQGNTITIKAQFRRINSNIESLEIRAIDPTVTPPGSGCMAVIQSIFSALARAISGNVIGEVKAKTVRFQANGLSPITTFELQNVTLWQTGVGVRTTEWQWQYRLNSGAAWTNFDKSEHRVYSVLNTPTGPWQQTPFNLGNTQILWTDVLDHACRWALLTQTSVQAASRITQSVYNLGPSIIEYDCPHGGASHYTSSGQFNCTAFLDRITGGLGNGQYVNCTDCGTFVSVFSNAVGVDLWSSRMGYNFDLYPIKAIGSAIWQTACGWPGFSYHEVAWEGACTNADKIYDACLMVDSDGNPATPPHTGLLPTDIVFTTYRDMLVPAADHADCTAKPSTRIRRPVF